VTTPPSTGIDLTIRPAVPCDLNGLRELYRHLQPDDAPLSDTVADERWRAMLAHPGLTCVVGFMADQLVASCCLVIVPNLTRGGRSYALVENVVTHDAFRRRGVGRALIAWALAHAWDAGCYKAMLLSGSKRSAAHQFYEACGFRGGDKAGFVARPLWWDGSGLARR
jgi:GNAT superfamily N-acetyltransferase